MRENLTKKAYEKPTMVLFGTVRNLTGGSLTNGNDTLGPSGKNLSDRRVKENIVEVGSHPAGFGIYLFDYKAEYKARCGEGRQFGVMADEVAKVVPEAVLTDEFGFAMVDYDRLGITRH